MSLALQYWMGDIHHCSGPPSLKWYTVSSGTYHTIASPLSAFSFVMYFPLRWCSTKRRRSTSWSTPSFELFDAVRSNLNLKKTKTRDFLGLWRAGTWWTLWRAREIWKINCDCRSTAWRLAYDSCSCSTQNVARSRGGRVEVVDHCAVDCVLTYLSVSAPVVEHRPPTNCFHFTRSRLLLFLTVRRWFYNRQFSLQGRIIGPMPNPQPGRRRKTGFISDFSFYKMDLPEKAERAPSAPVWNSFPSPKRFCLKRLSEHRLLRLES